MSKADDFPYFNDTTFDVPAGGLVVVTGINEETGRALVARPAADSATGLAVNNPFLVENDRGGVASFAGFVRLAYDPQFGTPEAGDTLGSVSGSFLAKKGNKGFRCLGGSNNGFTNAVRTDADTAGDVKGPGLSTDNAVVRWDGTTGKAIQNTDSNPASGFSTKVTIRDDMVLRVGQWNTGVPGTGNFDGVAVFEDKIDFLDVWTGQVRLVRLGTNPTTGFQYLLSGDNLGSHGIEFGCPPIGGSEPYVSGLLARTGVASFPCDFIICSQFGDVVPGSTVTEILGGSVSVGSEFLHPRFVIRSNRSGAVKDYVGSDDLTGSATAGMKFFGGIYIGGTSTALTDPGDGVAGGTYP